MRSLLSRNEEAAFMKLFEIGPRSEDQKWLVSRSKDCVIIISRMLTNIIVFDQQSYYIWNTF